MTALPLAEISQETIRVLLVEDDPSVQDMLQILLRTKEIQCHDEVRGLKEKLVKFDPHVVILDFKLKDGDALEALGSFHSLVKRCVPIIYTAYPIPAPVQTQLYIMGVMNILTKPSNISTIESVIENYYEVSLKYRG